MTARRVLVHLGAAGVVAALGLTLAAELAAPSGEVHASSQAIPALDGLAAPLAPSPLVRPAPEAAREMVERPLFFQSRRPVPPEPLAVAERRPDPLPPLDFALVGTILVGSAKIALVKPDKAQSVELTPGQAVGGWTVTDVDTDRIMVRHGQIEQLVGLRDFGAAKALPAALRPPAPSRPPPPPPGQGRPPGPGGGAAPGPPGLQRLRH